MINSENALETMRLLSDISESEDDLQEESPLDIPKSDDHTRRNEAVNEAKRQEWEPAVKPGQLDYTEVIQKAQKDKVIHVFIHIHFSL